MCWLQPSVEISPGHYVWDPLATSTAGYGQVTAPRFDFLPTPEGVHFINLLLKRNRINGNPDPDPKCGVSRISLQLFYSPVKGDLQGLARISPVIDFTALSYLDEMNMALVIDTTIPADQLFAKNQKFYDDFNANHHP